jgi:hypothetical protein
MSWSALILCFAVLTPIQDKKPDKDAGTDQPAPKEKLIPLATYTVKLASADAAKHILVVKFPYRKGTRDVEFHALDEVKIRSKNPPLEFDEKGRPRKYTYRELKELKGPDSKLPGYQADFDSLKPGQDVQITLAKRKPIGKSAQLKKSDEDYTAQEKAKIKPSDKPEVMMVLILREPVK